MFSRKLHTVMRLSDYQKKIIKSINTKEVNNIFSFIQKYCPIDDKVADSEIVLRINDVGYAIRDELKMIDNLRNLTFVLSLLERSNLMYQTTEVGTVSMATTSSNQNLSYIFDFVSAHRKIHYLPTEELKTFIKNNYLTNEEIEYQEERKSRKKAQRLTIIVALGTLIITTIFNYFTYTTDRTVIIKNKDAFSDTISVNIIDSKEEIKTNIESDTSTQSKKNLNE